MILSPTPLVEVRDKAIAVIGRSNLQEEIHPRISYTNARERYVYHWYAELGRYTTIILKLAAHGVSFFYACEYNTTCE